MEPRHVGAVAVATALAVAGVATLVAADGTHTTVRPQVVADGEVVVDSVSSTRDGFLVVRRDDGGNPGEPIGHAAIETGIREDFRVGLDADLPDQGTVTLWAVVHEDADGDGAFDPGSDPAMRSVGGIAASTFRARAGEEPVFVTGLDTESRGTNATVPVTGVALDRPGYLVLRADDRGRPGEVVGNRSLDPGVHGTVEVPIDPGAYPDRRGYLFVWAVVYADDGDGTFEPDEDTPVTVGGRPVGTRMTVREVPQSELDRTTATATPTPTASESGDEGSGDGADDDASSGTTDREAVGVGVPGFGVVTAVVALALALAAVARRRGA